METAASTVAAGGTFSLLLAFNIAIGLAAFFGVTVLRGVLARLTALEESKNTNERLHALELADTALAVQVSGLREELPTSYIRRDDFREALSQIRESLKRIEDQLHNKADKA